MENPADGDQVLAETLFSFADSPPEFDDPRMLLAALRARELDRTLVRLGRSLEIHRRGLIAGALVWALFSLFQTVLQAV